MERFLVRKCPSGDEPSRDIENGPGTIVVVATANNCMLEK